MRTRFVILLSVLFLLAVAVASCVPAPWDIPGIFGVGVSLLALPFAVAGLALYFLPTIIAAVRHARNFVIILLVNIFAGWTGIGWIITLVWSIVDPAGK